MDFEHSMQSYIFFENPIDINMNIINGISIIEICSTFPRVGFVGLKWKLYTSHINFHSWVLTKIPLPHFFSTTLLYCDAAILVTLIWRKHSISIF